MKNMVSVLTLSVLLSSPLFVNGALADEKSAKDKSYGHGMNQSVMPGNGMMMSQEQMMGISKHMQEMQGIMLTIKNEPNPEKHQVLMQEHMQVMQQGMQMMHGGMGNDKNAGRKMGAMDMEKRMEMMGQRMGMMQMMMGQMMDHETEANKVPGHRHQ